MIPLASWISHHAKSDHAPPKTLPAFLRWALRGSEPVLLLSAAASITAGIVEMLSGLVLGLVIDASIASPREALFSENFWMLGAAIAFFLLIRPLAFGASSIMQSYVVAPNVHNLVLSRLHRWVLGHSVSFLKMILPGGLRKEMQTARAVTDVVIEILHGFIRAGLCSGGLGGFGRHKSVYGLGAFAVDFKLCIGNPAFHAPDPS